MAVELVDEGKDCVVVECDLEENGGREYLLVGVNILLWKYFLGWYCLQVYPIVGL